MKRINPFITGTIILTLTGLVSRMIGFFYRIFLSRLFGEEGMGVYQLLSPVLALSFSVTAAGMQSAISKYVAREVSLKDHRSAFRFLWAGLFFSLFLSLLCMGFIMRFSEMIAVRFLLEPRTASMLRIIALSIPVGAVHSCINGYFYGIKKTGLPSATQLLEQVCRIVCVLAAQRIAAVQGTHPTINAAVVGLVVGECFAMVVSLAAAYSRFCRFSEEGLFANTPALSYRSTLTRLLTLAVPLSFTRIVINFLQSIEAVYIPSRLQAYGYDSVTALSVYGVLTGMALPLLLFPNAFTGSVSLLLLPMVSEAEASGNKNAVRRTSQKTIYSCLLMGSLFTLGFYLCGDFLGRFLYDSELAGRFICTLSFLCPFMYLGTTLSSILHGLGKAGGVFFINVSSLLIRLFFVFFLMPRFGINGYLAGMLTSQIYAALGFLFLLSKLNKK